MRQIFIAALTALCATTVQAQSAVFLDTTLVNGATTAVVAPGQSFPVIVKVRSDVRVVFNAAQFLFYCTKEGMRIDGYDWSAPFVTGGPGDFSLEGAALPLVVNNGTLEGPGYPVATPDVEFAAFDFFQTASEGQLLRVSVRAPQKLPDGSTCFIGALPDLFTNAFQVVPVGTGTPLRVQISASAPPADVDGNGTVNSEDLSMVLSSWGMPSPVGRADGDLDEDGDVDGEDLAILLSGWNS